MKKHIKKYIRTSGIIFFLILSLTSLSFANYSITVDANAPKITKEDKKVLEDFLKILKDPNKVKAIANTLEEQTAEDQPIESPQETISTKIEELTANHIKSLDQEVTSFFILMYKKYNELDLIKQIQEYYYELKTDIYNANYEYFLTLSLVTLVFSLILLLIEYFYTKIYGKCHYINDFIKYKKQKSFIKAHIFLFFINIKYFLPIIIPPFLLIELIKINAHYINYGLIPESIINILIFFVILKLLLKFLDLVFYQIKRKTLISFKRWIFSLLYFFYGFLSSYYIFLILNNSALIKLNLVIFLILSLVFFGKFRFLVKKISLKIIKDRIQDYKKFVIYAKRYSVTLLYIAVYCYFISILFLDQSLTKSIIVRLFIVIIGLIFIYLIQFYIARLFVKKVAIKIEKRSKEITKKAFNKTETLVISLRNFWRFFKFLYLIIFLFVYLKFLDKVLKANYVEKLVDLTSNGIFNIITNIFISFCFLMTISFVFILFIEKYLHKLSKLEDIPNLRRFLTLYKILQKPYKMLFFIILLIVAVSSVGISLTALLASTGILTLLVAFGMKDILQNFFNSIMFLLENSFALNDFIELNGSTGTVEEISLVYVKIRDSSGNLIMIPFKNIGNITNYTKDFSYALVDVGVAYGTDIDKVFEALRHVGKELEEDSEINEFIASSIEILGVVALADSSVNIRCKIKTIAGKQFSVRTMLYKKIYQHFMAQGIEIPFPQTEVTVKKI